MLEKNFQKVVINYINTYFNANKELYLIKVIKANHAGVPDLIGCYKGLFFAIEIKSKIGRLTSLQVHHANRINIAEGIAIVLHYDKDYQWEEALDRFFNSLAKKVRKCQNLI